MPPAAGVAAEGDRAVVKPMMVQQLQPLLMTKAASEVFAKDAIIAWFRCEFAAANAIIDALCGHLTQLEGDSGGAVYQSVFDAIHQRRLNWIPIVQMQRHCSITDVIVELRKVVEKKRWKSRDVCALKNEELVNSGFTSTIHEKEKEKEKNCESSVECNDGDEVVGGNGNNGDRRGEVVGDSPKSDVTDSGSQEVQPFPEQHVAICSNHEECEARPAQIKMTKGFIAKEPVKGHLVNVVRGLKLYEDVFTDVELSKLNDFVNELRMAGQNGELSGDTFILYNQQMKGNKRELIQLGVPIFGQINEDATNKSQNSYIEPIPALLQDVIEHLIQWHLIPESRKPNSCIINFFGEGDYSQPFLKPPHLDQPLSTLLLSESTMAFGRALVSDSEGNYRGPLILSLKEGSLLVMKGNSSDTARHVMCSSHNKRISITFFRVRSLQTEAESHLSETTPSSRSMTIWQSGVPTPYTMPNNYDQTEMISKWGLVRSPMVMLAPVRPVAINPRRIPRDGTGVFLPETVGLRKPARHLPPRAQRRNRFIALHSPHTSDSGVLNSS